MGIWNVEKDGEVGIGKGIRNVGVWNGERDEEWRFCTVWFRIGIDNCWNIYIELNLIMSIFNKEEFNVDWM